MKSQELNPRAQSRFASFPSGLSVAEGSWNFLIRLKKALQELEKKQEEAPSHSLYWWASLCFTAGHDNRRRGLRTMTSAPCMVLRFKSSEGISRRGDEISCKAEGLAGNRHRRRTAQENGRSPRRHDLTSFNPSQGTFDRLA